MEKKGMWKANKSEDMKIIWNTIFICAPAEGSVNPWPVPFLINEGNSSGVVAYIGNSKL